MKCHDESKLLNYQEPHNYLYGNIKFHKPVQITFFLPPSVFLWGSEKQQEGTSLEELFICAPVISLDLHFVWGRNKEGVAGLFFIPPPPPCCLFAGGPRSFVFPLSSSVSFCSASFFLQKSSPSAPVVVLESTFIGQHVINSEAEKKKIKFPGDSAYCRMFRYNSLGWLFGGLENLSLLDGWGSARPWSTALTHVHVSPGPTDCNDLFIPEISPAWQWGGQSKQRPHGLLQAGCLPRLCLAIAGVYQFSLWSMYFFSF